MGKSGEQRWTLTFIEERGNLGRGYYEQKFIAGKWEPRVVAASHWLQEIEMVTSHWL